MLSSWFSRSAASAPIRTTRSASRNGEPVAARARRLARRAIVLVTIVGLAAAGSLAYLRAVDFLYRSPYFEIREVNLYGLGAGLKDELARTAGLDQLKGRNLVLLNVEKVRSQILRNPHVADATIRKIYPASLRIVAHERKAVAYLSGNGVWGVDESGVLMDKVGKGGGTAQDLPFITGVKAAGLKPGSQIDHPRLDEALMLLARMKEVNPSLRGALGELRLGAQGDLTLVFRGGAEVRFGSSDPLERMPALEKFLEGREGLANLQYVDLRFDKQLVYLDKQPVYR